MRILLELSIEEASLVSQKAHFELSNSVYTNRNLICRQTERLKDYSAL